MSEAGSDTGEKEDIPVLGVYEGERNALKERHGKGKNLYPNGDVYEGQYAKGKRHGKGVYTWKGTFANGKRHGLGVYQYINGDVYQGEWADDFRNGKGTYSYSTGGKKRGTWVNGVLSGPGEILHVDHSIVGNFINNNDMSMPVEVKFPKISFVKTIVDPREVGMQRTLIE